MLLHSYCLVSCGGDFLVSLASCKLPHRGLETAWGAMKQQLHFQELQACVLASLLTAVCSLNVSQNFKKIKSAIDHIERVKIIRS